MERMFESLTIFEFWNGSQMINNVWIILVNFNGQKDLYVPNVVTRNIVKDIKNISGSVQNAITFMFPTSVTLFHKLKFS
jgi:hypothetical protein